MAQLVTLMNCNHEGPYSNLGQGSTILSNVFHGFLQTFQVNAKVVC
jgi:hypothetical protein